MMARRIESKTSRTAEFTCMMRFQSYMEKRECYKSDDYITQAIVNSIVKNLFKMPLIRSFFLSKVYPAGMYEYVTARTRFIDEELRQALTGGMEQVLILGAGFDSRGIRFRSLSGNAVIYELDAPVTQKAKVERYKEKGVDIPDNLVFIPVDFERESMAARLLESGFIKGRKTLFILEGLTMYLNPEAVEETFKIIEEFSGAGSRVVFDHVYASVIRRENLYEGEKELYRSVLKRNEQFLFGLERGHTDEFLSLYGMKALKVMDSQALEEMFFRDGSGKSLAKVNGTHCIVTAAAGGL